MIPFKNIFRRAAAFLVTLVVFFSCSRVSAEDIVLTPKDYVYIRKMILMNECAGDKSKMIAWNEGEGFPSLGLGHFIWYTKTGGNERYQELFPQLIAYLEKHHQPIPEWIKKLPDKKAPWVSREDFLEDAKSNSPRMMSLRNLLTKTLGLQARFITRRTKAFLPKILHQTPAPLRKEIRRKFELVASTKEGLYAIIDYAHFKGDGLLTSERYHGRGWGLYQVLEEMRPPADGQAALLEFIRTAKTVLERRVADSPAGRNEKKWLPGWLNRVESYRPA